MCGVFGYLGDTEDAAHSIYSGLTKLEYRGYDSCGIAVITGEEIKSVKVVGSPENLPYKDLGFSSCGIGHTRWATHGKVTLNNAHPHISSDGRVCLVHNGIIENHAKIKKFLQKNFNCSFHGETDSEILVNLISFHWKDKDDPLSALKIVLEVIEGTVGIAVLFKGYGNQLYGARRGSPLLLGINGRNRYLISDANALPSNVEKVIHLKDNQIISINESSFDIYDLHQELPANYEIEKVALNNFDAGHEGYSSFMEKEILQQPETIRAALSGRINADLSSIRFGGINLDRDITKGIKRVLFLGCGTAYHAGLIGKYAIENYANIPATAEIASEYKYKNNPTEEGTFVIAISQSGETSDTLAALMEAQNKGLDSMAITNVVSSSISRQAGKGIYQHAGPEVSVASTKAFTSQVTILLMLSILLGRKKSLSAISAKKYISELNRLPELIEETLLCGPEILEVIEMFKYKRSFMFLGRQFMYPIALESALKLKEIAYLDAQGYPAGEFKHGPLALIDEKPLCIYFATQTELLQKNLSNMQEIKARNGRLLVIAQKNQKIPKNLYDYIIRIPESHSFIQPVLAVIPMQLLAMHFAQSLGLNVDRPRNLAKSVTVE